MVKIKVIAIVASHKRYEILKDCISCLKPQVNDIVLAGSSCWVDGVEGCSLAKMVAKEEDLIYVDHTNKILGTKWAAALNRARDENADAVLICGSDDLLASDWVCQKTSMTSPYFADGFSICGVNSWYVYNPIIDEMIQCTYRSEQRSDPLGAGRLISKTILDHVDWQIFPSEAIGCDLYSYRKLGSPGYSKIYSTCLCVKGNWNMLDSWEQLIGAESLDIGFYGPNGIDEMLKRFPDIDFDKYKK